MKIYAVGCAYENILLNIEKSQIKTKYEEIRLNGEYFV